MSSVTLPSVFQNAPTLAHFVCKGSIGSYQWRCMVAGTTSVAPFVVSLTARGLVSSSAPSCAPANRGASHQGISPLTFSDGLTSRSAPENVGPSDDGVWESAVSRQVHRRRRSNPPRKLSGPGPHAEDNLERGAVGAHRRGPPAGGASSQVQGQIWGGLWQKPFHRSSLSWSA